MLPNPQGQTPHPLEATFDQAEARALCVLHTHLALSYHGKYQQGRDYFGDPVNDHHSMGLINTLGVNHGYFNLQDS